MAGCEHIFLDLNQGYGPFIKKWPISWPIAGPFRLVRFSRDGIIMSYADAHNKVFSEVR